MPAATSQTQFPREWNLSTPQFRCSWVARFLSHSEFPSPSFARPSYVRNTLYTRVHERVPRTWKSVWRLRDNARDVHQAAAVIGVSSSANIHRGINPGNSRLSDKIIPAWPPTSVLINSAINLGLGGFFFVQVSMQAMRKVNEKQKSASRHCVAIIFLYCNRINFVSLE